MRCSERPSVVPAGVVEEGPRREAKGQMSRYFSAQRMRNFKMHSGKLAVLSRLLAALCVNTSTLNVTVPLKKQHRFKT